MNLVQVGAGSGGMPVLDMLCREPRIRQVTLIEPDVYKPHNVERHVFPPAAVGEFKAVLAEQWVKERRPDLEMRTLILDLLKPAAQAEIEDAIVAADIGVCAVDNEPAKYHWDALMRKHRKPWTLGEVLSGGIGGFVHWFAPDGPCYGCVASHLKREVTVEKSKAPDYSQPGGPVAETTIPASKASIEAIASLHALLTLRIAAVGQDADPDRVCQDRRPDPQPQSAIQSKLGFTSLLLTLQRVPEVFDEAFRPYRLRIPRSAECLICRAVPSGAAAPASEDLDVALDQALARLGNE